MTKKILFITEHHTTWTKQEIDILKKIGYEVLPLYLYEDYRKKRMYHGFLFKLFSNNQLLDSIMNRIHLIKRALTIVKNIDIIYCWFAFP
ncbi:hypothetical protein DRN46_07155, partial [Thermococci archaeon]